MILRPSVLAAVLICSCAILIGGDALADEGLAVTDAAEAYDIATALHAR